jgi:hypothetical protein
LKGHKTEIQLTQRLSVESAAGRFIAKENIKQRSIKPSDMPNHLTKKSHRRYTSEPGTWSSAEFLNQRKLCD